MRIVFMVLVFCVCSIYPAYSDRLLDLQLELCRGYKELDSTKYKPCMEKLLKETKRRRDRLIKLKKINDVGLKFLVRFGIDYPDLKAKYIVAKKRGVLAALIAHKCRLAEKFDPNPKRFAYCLDQNEKAERWSGNKLDRPAPKP